jgi:hypothetical protein
MTLSQLERLESLANIQLALLGEISSEVRVISAEIEGEKLSLTWYFDGQPSELDIESASCTETELIADYPVDFELVTHLVQCDYPNIVPKIGIWVYARREQLDC